MASEPPVHVLHAGGTIGMTAETGHSVTPEHGAEALIAAMPALAARENLAATTLFNLPSAHLTLENQLEICRRARDLARVGIGVVVTHGTDTLEETAMLCDILHDGSAPVVLTGAMRPASEPGADGPANLVDAVTVAAAPAAAGLGVLVVFGGEIHHARTVRKTDTTSLVAFTSPQTGPLGRVTEGHATIWSRLPRTRRSTRPPWIAVSDRCPPGPVTTALWRAAALGTEPDGVVIGTLGAGHLAPAVLELWAGAAERIPVIAYCRPERGVILNATYGYPGSERDLRGTGIIPAGFLSPRPRA